MGSLGKYIKGPVTGIPSISIYHQLAVVVRGSFKPLYYSTNGNLGHCGIPSQLWGSQEWMVQKVKMDVALISGNLREALNSAG